MMEERKSVLKANLFWMILVILNLVGSQFIGLFVKNATASILVAQALIVVPVVIYLFATKQNPIELLKLHRFHFGSAILVILLAFCMYPIVAVINSLSMMFASNLTANTITGITSEGLLYGLGIMALLPACVEEITFRGVLMGTYDKGRRPVRAILFSALAFAFMHMNLNQICYALFMGFVFGLVVEITGSLFSSVLMHFTINGTSVVVSWAVVEAQKQLGVGAEAIAESVNAATQASPKEMLDTALMMLPFALITAGIGWLLIKAIANLNGRQEQLHFWLSKEYKEDRAEITKVRIVDIFYVIAALLCLSMAILIELVLRGVIRV